MPSPSSRRQVLRGAGALAALGAVGAGGFTAHRTLNPAVDPAAEIPLWSQTVVYDAEGRRRLAGGRATDAAPAPGSRLSTDHPDPSATRERASQFWEGTAAWRSALAETPGISEEMTSLAGSALRDLWVLCDELPAPVAGWNGPWRYIWPRDAAFCAAALARVGHLDAALSTLRHLQSLQARDGWFEARYDPGTGKAPDGRHRQFDGTGLLLWAAAEVADAAGPERGDEVVDALDALITTSLSALHTGTRGGAGLPPVSPDYWEVRERSVTLGIMAATLTGLRAGAHLTGRRSAQEAAETFAVLLSGTFGRHGHQRYRRGGGPDSALAFFDATGCHGVVRAEQLLSLRASLARPGGGIAPGASWREDGISWTPSTSLLGLGLARAGEREAASQILHWLAEHRTEAGSLPEKVLFDGRPAEVAPLAWTAANAVIALDELLRT
ncbi:MAG: hypothetical protein GX960_15490 [Actinomycetales bacterium]|nr:hypothetical protein [Actinomycetales bacterium]